MTPELESPSCRSAPPEPHIRSSEHTHVHTHPTHTLHTHTCAHTPCEHTHVSVYLHNSCTCGESISHQSKEHQTDVMKLQYGSRHFDVLSKKEPVSHHTGGFGCVTPGAPGASHQGHYTGCTHWGRHTGCITPGVSHWVRHTGCITLRASHQERHIHVTPGAPRVLHTSFTPASHQG